MTGRPRKWEWWQLVDAALVAGIVAAAVVTVAALVAWVVALAIIAQEATC